MAAVQWWHSACVCTVVAELVAVLVQCTVAAVLHVVVAVLVEFVQRTVQWQSVRQRIPWKCWIRLCCRFFWDTSTRFEILLPDHLLHLEILLQDHLLRLLHHLLEILLQDHLLRHHLAILLLHHLLHLEILLQDHLVLHHLLKILLLDYRLRHHLANGDPDMQKAADISVLFSPRRC